MKHSVLCLLLLIFVSALKLHGQQGWFWQNPLPVGGAIGTVKFVSATEGWMIAEGAQLLHTTTAGATWNVQSPSPGTLLSSINGGGLSLSFLNATTGWMIGTFGDDNINPLGPALYKTTNSGGSWTQQPVGSGAIGFAVQFIDANNGWVTTGNGSFQNLSGSILHSTDGGNTWSLQYTTGANAIISSISFVDINNGWAVIDSFSSNHNGLVSPAVIIHTTNGGVTWTSQFTDNTPGIFEAIQFLDANNGWVVGDSAKVLHTTNGGSSWTPVTIAGISSTSKNRSLFFLDANNGWISTSVSGGNNISHTTNGGATWTTQSPGTQYAIFSTYFFDANNGWVSADYGGIAHTTNGGANWTLQSSSVTNNTLRSVFALPDGNRLWVGGDNGTILYTSDGGTTWSNQFADSNSISGFFFRNANLGYAVGYGHGGRYTKTTDGGANWIILNRPTGDDPDAVYFTDDLTGYAVGSAGTIVKTIDGGTSWTQENSSTTKNLSGVYFIDSFTGIAVGDSGKILMTTIGGTTWMPEISGTFNNLHDVVFSDANTGTAVGNNGTILRTTNGGTVWFSQPSGTTENLYGVSLTDANHGTVVGEGGAILRTTNGGVTWTRQPSGKAGTIRGVAFSSTNTGTVVGDNGAIIRTTSGGALAVRGGSYPSIPIGFELKQNYPNPFNPTTLINYQLPAAGRVSLKVYDILGREIATLVDGAQTPGDHFIQWDGSSLPSGVYFYRIQSGLYSETKKLLLMR
ncbi:MAG: YCF48-related protein [Bacteroidota bacterium]